MDTLRFLVAEHRSGAVGDENWARAGEPVVPNFPTGDQNTFLGIDTFKPVPFAKVVTLRELDIDMLAGVLKKQFPGLPPELHDAYVLAMAKAAMALPLGAVVQIYVTEDSTVLKAVESAYTYTLWDQQPIPERYTR